QVLNRVEVGRVSWQLFNRQPLGVRLEKHFQRRARVITSSILNHDHMVSCLGQDIEQKRLVALCVETPSMGFVEKAPGKEVNETIDVVGLAFAAGRHLSLLAFGRPRVAQRAPLGKTGLIAKEQQSLTLFGLAENLGPAGVTPLEAFGFIEVIGDKTSF